MRKILKRLPKAALFLLLAGFLNNLFISKTSAQEITLLGGVLGASALTGCCAGVAPSLSGGMILRFDKLGFINRTFEVAGLATTKWVEFTVGPTFDLYGERPQPDPGASNGLSITRVSDFNITASFGAGLLSLSSRTIAFDLPAQISALLLYGRAHFSYTVNDQWSIILVPGIGFALAQNYMSLYWSTNIGPQFRF